MASGRKLPVHWIVVHHVHRQHFPYRLRHFDLLESSVNRHQHCREVFARIFANTVFCRTILMNELTGMRQTVVVAGRQADDLS